MRRFDTLIQILPVSWIHLVSRNQWRYPTLRRLCDWGASLFRNQDGVIPRGAGKGLRFNVGESHGGFLLGSHEPEIQELLVGFLRPGTIFYDVGANVGFFSMIAARLVGPAGKIISVEPLPANASAIQHNAALNRFSQVRVLAEALGCSDRDDHFRVSDAPIWGKLAGVGADPDRLAGRIGVRVRKMDTLCVSGGFPVPDVIKMDVEGAETEALQGGSSVLSTHRPLLMIELHVTNAEVADTLDGWGYFVMALGESTPIRSAKWNAVVVAAPSERADLVELMKNVRSRVAA